mgnify:CR=1 FL=1
MTIRERGYAHWDGELEESKFSWWPIATYGVKLTFKKKFFKSFFFFTFIPALAYLGGIYVSERLEDFHFMIEESAPFIQVNPAYFKSYFTNDFLLFIIVMIIIFAGAGLISDDIKYNALQLYFSRPLKKKDYFIGKASVIFFFMALITLIPGLIFLLTKIIFSGSFKFVLSYPWLPFSTLGYSLILIVFFSFYSLSISSLSKNRRYVAVMIFGIYFFSDIFFQIFYGIFKNQYFSLLSIKANLKQIGAFIFGQKLPYSIPWFYSFLFIIAFCTFGGLVLKRRVKGVVIVK